MKQLVIFDLDGTLLDTSAGIIHCYNETARHFGAAPADKARFQGIIGGPLKAGFEKLYGLGDATADQAVAHYRVLYEQTGMRMYDIYPGIADLLAQLREAGVQTAVATLKLEKFAKIMLAEAGLVFDAIFGEDGTGLSKAHLLQQAMARLGMSPGQSLLVGDSIYDAQGAQQAGLDFIAVTYGWGFANRDDAARSVHSAIAESVAELSAKLFDSTRV